MIRKVFKRSNRVKAFICLSAGCLLLACLLLPGRLIEAGRPEKSGLSGSPLKGKNIFVSKGCINCHAVWGVGGKSGPDLARIGMGKDLLEVAGSLWNHSPIMTGLMQERGVARPVFTPEEMGDFISYLYYVNYFNEPGNTVAGRRLFSEKGCINCHSIKGQGERVGPPLDDYRRYTSSVFIAQAMWNHGPQMAATMQGLKIEKPYFRGNEAADLLAFIRGQSLSEALLDKFMPPGSPTLGEKLFGEKGCASCHVANGRGRSAGPNLSRTGSYKSVLEIAGAMWNHGPQVWATMQRAGKTRPIFKGNEMADVISYLYFISYMDERGNQIAGKRLFAAKGCAECHRPGKTKSIDHSLSASPALSSPINLMTSMWNHAATMQKLAQEKGLTWPTFERNEMRDLVAYIKSSARASAR